MKSLKILPIILSFIGICSSNASGGNSINYTAIFPSDGLEISNDTVNSKVYSRLSCQDCDNDCTEGFPELPVRHLQFIVPVNASDFKIASAGSPETRSITDKVIPAQPPRIAGFATDDDFNEPSEQIYSVDKYYPTSIAKIVGEGYIDGNKHIITIAVYPIQYNPLQGQLKVFSSIDLKLSYSLGTAKKLSPINRVYQIESSEDLIGNIVVNKAQISEFTPVSNQAIATMAELDFPTYEYCVVTSKSLAPYFSKLIDWKRQKGYKAGVVCIEDILSNPLFADGDVVSNIKDDAGKLRAYLRYSYELGNGKYVLFGGDASILPIRYGFNSLNFDEEFWYIPTDLYFSDLNGDWNTNGDNHYGESVVDNVDYAPELYVGRLLCKNEKEISNYTEKLLQYEINPGNGDFSYLVRAFLTECDQMLQKAEADKVDSCLSTFDITSTIFKEAPTYYDPNPTFPTGNDCIAQMEKVRYGFFGWHGHGNPGGVGVKSNGNHTNTYYGILALQKNNCYHVPESANGLENLTNYKYPAISYSASCTLNPFDKLSDPVYDIEYNVGASFTVGGLYGGPAFLGNTRYGWYNGPSIDLEKSFWKCLPLSRYKLGVAEALSKQFTSDIDTHYNYVKYGHNLIGCPEFEMWTAIPTRYLAPTIKRNNYGVTVSCPQRLSEGYIATTSANGTPQIYEIKSNIGLSSQSYNITADPNSPVMIYAHNKIPYIFPLWLQNGNCSDKKYIFASKVKMGSRVDFQRYVGNYYFSAGADVTIDATGNVEIYLGTEFLPQSSVSIISKTEVALHGGIVRSGATLNITAPNVIIDNDFEVEKGGILNINN